MKKIISLILCIVSILSLSACSDKEPAIEYERIELTESNYSNYLNINIYLSDYIAIKDGENYDLAVTVHIETSKRSDCVFEKAEISYNNAQFSWNASSLSISGVGIDYEGSSHISYIASKEDSPTMNITTALLTSKNGFVKSVSGYVIVPKEGL